MNVLKRMGSAVSSFALTVGRQIVDVESMLARIEAHAESVEEVDIADVDIEDPAFEALLVGRKIKVLFQDVDFVRWKQDLVEDRNRLVALYAAATQVTSARDAKLEALRHVIEQKRSQPINPGNRKAIVFTAFFDTARYLYEQLSPWALKNIGAHSALITGTGGNQTTVPGLRKDLVCLFAPGGIYASKGEFTGMNDFEVVAFLVVLPFLPNDFKE